MTNYYMPAIKT